MEEQGNGGIFARLGVWAGRWRALIAAMCSIVLIVLFFFAPANSAWLRDRIVAPLQDIKTEHTKMGIEERMQYRFDSDYVYSKQIARLFEQKGIKDKALVLGPPAAGGAAGGMRD